MTKLLLVVLFVFGAFALGCTAIVETFSELPGDGPATDSSEPSSTDTALDGGVDNRDAGAKD
jgi:hypothetical protein